MHKRYNKKKLGVIFIFSLVILNISLINALGVAAPYSGSNLPLEMYAGEQEVVRLELQNWDIEEEIILEGTILEGSEIAFLNKSSVKVPYQVKVSTEMIIKIPKSAKVGDKYNILYEFKQVGGEGEGMVVFSQGIKRNFDVNIIERPKVSLKEEIGIAWMILGVVLIIILAVIISFLIQNKKKGW